MTPASDIAPRNSECNKSRTKGASLSERRFELTKKQIKSIESLERAFKRCKDNGLEAYVAASSFILFRKERISFLEERVPIDAPNVCNDEYEHTAEDYNLIIDSGAP